MLDLTTLGLLVTVTSVVTAVGLPLTASLLSRRRRVAAPAPVPLFTSHPPRALGVLFGVIGLASFFFGLVLAVQVPSRLGASGTDAAELADVAEGAAVAGALSVLGAGEVLIWQGIRRTRLDVYDDRFLVQRWFRPARWVLVSDIASFRPLLTPQSGIGGEGIDARDERRRRLFVANRRDDGYEQVIDHLEQRTPDELRSVVRPSPPRSDGQGRRRGRRSAEN